GGGLQGAVCGAQSASPAGGDAPDLVNEEGFGGASSGGGENQVPADSGRRELADVAVLVGGPRRVVRGDLLVECLVGGVPLVAGQRVRGGHLPVQRRHVQVGEVVVVRLVDVVAVQEDVDEVVRVRVVGEPADERGVERLTL